MSDLCEGRVVIVTGAGRGLGRAHALAFAAAGAKVVVNDLGAEVDGTGSSSGPAGEVVDEIRAGGGEAVANGEDVSDFEGAHRLVDAAINAFGALDVVVNNAGILRDRMLFNMSMDEWDDVVRVHLRSTFVTTRWAATYWREQFKTGLPVSGRIINTTSGSGLYGNPGQSNYGAAKAGIAAFTVIAAEELRQYGVTVNAIAPIARTRMTIRGKDPAPEGEFDMRDPANVSPLVVWLGSRESGEVTGRVFNVFGDHVDVAEGWRAGSGVDAGGRRFEPAELRDVISGLVEKAPGRADIRGRLP